MGFTFSNSVAEGAEDAEALLGVPGLTIRCLRDNRQGLDGTVRLAGELLVLIETEQHCRRRCARSIIGKHRRHRPRITLVIGLEARAAARHLAAEAGDLLERGDILVAAVVDAIDPAETRRQARDVVSGVVRKLVPSNL